MKFSLTLLAILAGALAAPTTLAHSQRRNANAIVSIRLEDDAGQHYSVGDVQQPSSPSGSHVSVLVGQQLDFNSNAPILRVLNIAQISEGLSLNAAQVQKDDTRVLCKASINSSSGGPTFSIADEQIFLDQGQVAKLTGLSCWFEQEC